MSQEFNDEKMMECLIELDLYKKVEAIVGVVYSDKTKESRQKAVKFVADEIQDFCETNKADIGFVRNYLFKMLEDNYQVKEIVSEGIEEEK